MQSQKGTQQQLGLHISRQSPGELLASECVLAVEFG